ncbi:MAG: hypothetical protein Kow00121_44430 [Elainellaceae cyanobacterium]
MQPLSQRMHKYTTRLFTRLFIVTTLGILATSCSESKLSQCRQLIDVANQVVSDVQTVAQNASTTATGTNSADSVAVISQVAESADKAQIRMEELQLTDETLQGFQARYAEMYTEIRETTRDMLSAAEVQDREAGKAAYEAFKTATSQEEGLVEEINAYCAE